jgi:hypothetical protein
MGRPMVHRIAPLLLSLGLVGLMPGSTASADIEAKSFVLPLKPAQAAPLQSAQIRALAGASLMAATGGF